MTINRSNYIRIINLPPEILSLIATFLQNDSEKCIDMPFRVIEYDAEPIADAWREWQDSKRSYDVLNFMQSCSLIRRSTIHILWQQVNLSRLFMVEFMNAFIRKLLSSNSNHPCLFGIVQQVTFSEFRISPFPFWWQRRSQIKLGGYYRKLPIGLYTREKSRHQLAKVDCISDMEELQDMIGFILISTQAKRFSIHQYVYLPAFDHHKLVKLMKSGIMVIHPNFKFY